MARKPTSRGKQKEKRQVAHGHAYVHSTFNNTIVTITDPAGNVLCWSSAGNVGFKGSRKGTPFAAQLSAESCCKKSKDHGLQSVDVFLSGPGGGRETAVRSLNANGLEVKSIRDVTPLPHNGCRPPKKRRV
ncbi:MAG: 30S ribosomal protein S11 [Fimbriimonadaceae bacterium]|nr:30S ribosomal protein S11 [Fimbriimonadaceae bacterium]